jgi:hypothetical protein
VRNTSGLVPFKPGQSGNPGGKPIGTRNKLQGDFLRALAEDFEKWGKAAIADCRQVDPAAYIRAIVALMPKELEITRPLDDLSDEQLDAALAAVAAICAARDPAAGEGRTAVVESAQELPAVPQAG